VALSTHLFAFGRLESFHLELISAHGFDAIELWGMKPHLDWDDPKDIRWISNLLSRLKIDVASCHLPFYTIFGHPDFRHLSLADPSPFWRKEAVKKCFDMAKIASDLGCNLLVLHGIGDIETSEKDSARLFYREAFYDLFDVVSPLGMVIAIENIMTTESDTKELADFCRSFSDPGVGICLDIGHANITEEPIQAAIRCRPYLLAAHIADNHGVDDEHLIPYRGNINWKAVTGELLKAAHLQTFTLELMYPIIGADRSIYETILSEAQEALARIQTEVSWNIM